MKYNINQKEINPINPKLFNKMILFVRYSLVGLFSTYIHSFNFLHQYLYQSIQESFTLIFVRIATV